MIANGFGPGKAVRYRFTGYDKFLDADGYPAVVPPAKVTLAVIDLNTGRYLWKVPLGSYPELVAKGLTDTGSENYGGPLLTASGIVFIGATIYDHKMRAFDSTNGRLLWEHELPYAGTATPATYFVDGRQYLVIATSNARNPKAAQGNAYIAFALPVNPLQLVAHHVTAQVRDIDRAVLWYKDVLGFTVAERGSRRAMQFAEMKIPGYGVALVQFGTAASTRTATSPSDAPASGEARWMHVVFSVPDAERAFNELKARGANPFLRPGQPSSPVTTFLLNDSEGNELEITSAQ